jgi:SAM-dependent methyltransferase
VRRGRGDPVLSDVFGDTYSGLYDEVYTEKDYAAECDLLEEIFRRDACAPVRSIVDLGCGTGGHAIPLAARGYDVVGVDRSEGMLARARSKAGHDRVTFHRGDIRSVDLGRRFDAALMMFAVLGYQTSDADVLAALRNARRHLVPGGLLVFDVWYGPAVLHQRPSERVRIFPTESGRIERAASGELDTLNQVCTVRIRVRRYEGERLAAESDESHAMRFFFPLELNLLLQAAELELARLTSADDAATAPDETTWSVIVAARDPTSSSGRIG